MLVYAANIIVYIRMSYTKITINSELKLCQTIVFQINYFSLTRITRNFHEKYFS